MTGTTTADSAAEQDRMTTTQVYRVYIKTTPQAIWDAITRPEWTARYGYGGSVDFDLRPGGRLEFRASDEMRAASEARGNPLPDVVIDGEVIEADPPRRLVHTFHMMMDPGTAAEAPTRVTYDITETSPGLCRLTLTHELEGAPNLAMIVGGAWEEMGAGGGHAWVLSDLKTLLETGSGFNG
jgi:uncharacterized protein YndB with AHSA1/START domain